MSMRMERMTAIVLVFGACATAPIEQEQTNTAQSSNMPTAAEDLALMDAWMAADRGRTGGNLADEAAPFRPKSTEKNPVKFVQWAVAHPDRQAGWRTCLDLKSRQDRGDISAFSPWPFVCRAMLLAEQRMFDQSDRMLSASNIKLAAVEIAYIRGHLAKKRYDRVREHLAKAREAMPDHPLLDLMASRVATDKAEEKRLLEAVYAKDAGHYGALKRLARFYDSEGDPRSLELYLKAAEINPKDTEMRMFLAGRFVKNGQIDKAREQYLEIIKAVPHDESALLFLADDAAKRKQWGDQLDYVRTLIAKVKDTQERRILEAQLLAKTNKLDAAMAAYKALLKAKDDLVVAHLGLAEILVARGKPLEGITHMTAAGEAGRAALAELGERYEVGEPLPTKSKGLNPVIWKAEALLKERFKEARKRAPLIKGGRVSWTLRFDEEGQCVEVIHDSRRVDDPWFLVGGYILHLGVANKSVAGGEISWDLQLP